MKIDSSFLLQILLIIIIITMSSRAVRKVMAAATSSSSSASSKRISIIRHGQAMHNPRAEVAKANGCSMDEFLQLMRQDDVLDAPLTDLGRHQAVSVKLATASKIDLVVSSPLSRALETADLVHPSTAGATLSSSSSSSSRVINRVCCEHFREVNGEMLNAKRRPKSELQSLFKSWNFDDLQTEHDSLWTDEMEKFEDVAERGYRGLCWLMDRPEESILLVCHGGILRYMMNLHPLVSLQDERSTPGGKGVESRFDNCEVRHYILSWNDSDEESLEPNDRRRNILMTEIDASEED